LPSWKLYLCLRKLLRIISWKEVFATDEAVYNDASMTYFETRLAIQQQLGTSKMRLVPKHIWSIHYGWQAQAMGSLAHLDTNIGEQKNSQMKGHSQRAKQSKNVLKTMALREKFTTCFNSSAELLEYQPLGEKTFLNLCESDKLLACRHSLQASVFFDSVQMWGSKFRSDGMTCVCLGHPREYDLFVIKLIMKQDKLIFLLEEMRKEILGHLDLYVLEPTDNFVLASPDNFVHGKPVRMYSLKDFSNSNKFYCSPV